ncbi:MAG: sigma-70 family RNA polymerase sigma factor [Fuerstiella sp.]
MAYGIEVTSMSLLGRAKANDEDAWHQVVHLYGPLVEKWCRRYGLSEEDAADVFQETFKTVARHIVDFVPGRSVASFRSWLKTIVRTRTIDFLRKSKRHIDAAGGTAAQVRIADLPDPLGDDLEEESEADDALVVHRAMDLIRNEFDPRNWSAFEQVALKGRTATEVAAELGVAPQTIRQANYRIRRRLRLILQNLVE